MSSAKESGDTASQNGSTAVSPSDTRTPPVRFESITRGDDDNGSTASAALRRNRPSAITTSTENYGM